MKEASISLLLQSGWLLMESRRRKAGSRLSQWGQWKGSCSISLWFCKLQSCCSLTESVVDCLLFLQQISVLRGSKVVAWSMGRQPICVCIHGKEIHWVSVSHDLIRSTTRISSTDEGTKKVKRMRGWLTNKVKEKGFLLKMEVVPKLRKHNSTQNLATHM